MSKTKHGQTDSLEHQTWMRIRRRCEDTTHPDYADYGGRGIVVCERWRGPDGAANFLADMGPRPHDKTSIDRIDNDGPYSPENCRWADWPTQMRNRRSNRILDFAGATGCLMDWARFAGLSQPLLSHRLDTLGWSVERALTTPANTKPFSNRSFTIDGVTLSYAEWAKRNGVSKGLLAMRLNAMRWPTEKALTTPPHTKGRLRRSNDSSRSAPQAGGKRTTSA